MALVREATTDLGSVTGTSLSGSVNFGSNSNRLGFVHIFHTGDVITSVTIGGAACTLLRKKYYAAVGGYISVYYKVSPSSGSQTVAISASGSIDMFAHAYGWSGARQVTIPDAQTDNEANSTSITTPITPVSSGCHAVIFSASQRNLTASTGVTARVGSGTQIFSGDSNGTVTAGATYNMTLNLSASHVVETIVYTVAPIANLIGPSALTVTGANGSNSLTLNWTDNDNDETEFRIERSNDGSTGWTQIGTTASDVTTYLDSGVGYDTTRYYRVRSYRSSDGNLSSYTSTVSATTAPAAPTGLGITANSSDQPVLAWTDNSTTEANFRVERKPTGGSFAEIGTSTTSPYTDTTSVVETPYTYRVRAYSSSSGLYSAYTSDLAVTTPAVAPSDLVASCCDDNADAKVDLAWKIHSVGETGFLVERSPNGSSWSTVDTTRPGERIFRDNGLTPNTTYYYRISAVGPSCNSYPSATVQVKTKKATLASVRDAFLRRINQYPT